MVSNEYFITIPVTIVSLTTTILITVVAVSLLGHFCIGLNIHSDQKTQHTSISRYFRLTASISIIFCALNSFWTSIYCLYFLWDPLYDDKTYYIQHPSHIQRITATVSWYIAKVSLIWFFSGRLYYAFKGSVYRVNRRHMRYINVFNTIFAVISISFAYHYTYANNELLAELSFNLWRFQYQIVILTVLYMFSRRLLYLTVDQQSVDIIASSPKSTVQPENQTIEHHTHNKNSSIKDTLNFLLIITRYATLTLTLSFSTGLVIFCWFAFRFLFGNQTRLTLLIPMMMASFDSLITSICIICLFHIGGRLYYKLCRFCDKRCYDLSKRVSVRLLNKKTMAVLNNSAFSVSLETRTRTKSNSISDEKAQNQSTDVDAHVTVTVTVDDGANIKKDTDLDTNMKNEIIIKKHRPAEEKKKVQLQLNRKSQSLSMMKRIVLKNTKKSFSKSKTDSTDNKDYSEKLIDDIMDVPSLKSYRSNSEPIINSQQD